jgi:DNA ligase-1
MTLLAEVVAASRQVGATSSRSRKVAILAELLQRLEPDELAPTVGFLTGAPSVRALRAAVRRAAAELGWSPPAGEPLKPPPAPAVAGASRSTPRPRR